MPRSLLAVICLLISFISFAQTPVKTYQVQGSVLDSANNQPLSFVTVSISDAATKKPVKSSLSKDDGTFAFKGLPAGAYLLNLVYVGYGSKQLPFKGGVDFNAGSIKLAATTSQLKNVVVSGAKPLMKREVDRISYDVQADPEIAALSALDMMRKVPLLAVDGNDNIQLKGSSNYKILINGKESALVAKNPSDILKAMSATNIEKIEVITTPPAKYDAEGLAGIINIVTKRNADQGYLVGVNSRFNTVYGAGYNLNSTFKKGKFGISLIAGWGNQGNTTNTSGNTENIFASKSNIQQDGTFSNTGNNHYGTTELSYEIDTLNLITASVNLFAGDQHQGSMLDAKTDSAGILKRGYLYQDKTDNSFTGLDAALNYQLGFAHQKDRLFTISYKFSYAPNSQFNDNTFANRFNYPQTAFPNYRQNNDSYNCDHTIQADYASNMSKHTAIEAGVKAILRSNSSDFEVSSLSPATNQYIVNSTQTNNFTYHQNIISLYNSYQLKLEKWTGKAGLRLEHTGINADFTSSGVSTAPSYNNLIPSVSILRSFKVSSLSLGYTQRIQRPGIQQLNPFVDRSVPPFASTGNPALKPELDNSFEFSYSNFAKNAVTVGLSYAFSNNSIQNVSSLQIEQLNGKTDTITYTTYQNLGTNKTLGLNANTNLNINKNFTLGLNGDVSEIWLSGIFGNKNYSNKGLTGNAQANMRYKFKHGFSASFNAGYYSGNVTLQGRSSDYIYNQYLLSKDFFGRKLTFVLVANNPYSKFIRQQSTINSADFYQVSYNESNYRTLAFRVNFKFGKLTGDIKKNQHGINNDDLKSSGQQTTGNG